jgi:hypothetical protein
VETGLVIIGLLYIALSVWAITSLFLQHTAQRSRRRGG